MASVVAGRLLVDVSMRYHGSNISSMPSRHRNASSLSSRTAANSTHHCPILVESLRTTCRASRQSGKHPRRHHKLSRKNPLKPQLAPIAFPQTQLSHDARDPSQLQVAEKEKQLQTHETPSTAEPRQPLDNKPQTNNTEELIPDVDILTPLGFTALTQRWEVPWGWKTVVLTMSAWGFTFIGTGLFIAVGTSKLGLGRRDVVDLDTQAIVLLAHQLAQTSLGLLLIRFVSSRFGPLPKDMFNYQPQEPFAWPSGWLTWGLLGIPMAYCAVQVAALLAALGAGGPNTAPPTREDADALVQLLPIIAASPASTLSLLTVTGVCAPLLEETIFRGFVLTSLTKWLPTSAAILLSAALFAGVHLNPSEFPQLMALGVVLGAAYAQTRNLLTPMLIHGAWNSGVILLLTALRMQGYNIEEFL